MAANAITKFLTSPSNVAHKLDWVKASGAILSLRVLKDRIDLAVASHPTFENSTAPLPSIPLETRVVNNRKVLKESVASELKTILQTFNVCGMVVSWPVQKEGWCGASCGRVLHTLDQIAASKEGVLSKNRPICLYDPEHHIPPEDEWGRAEVYSHTSDKEVHVASLEQYNEPSGKVAVDIWNDFCCEHWPEFNHAQEMFGKKNQQEFSNNSSASLFEEDSPAYTVQAAV